MKKFIYIFLLLTMIFIPINVFAEEKESNSELIKNAISGLLIEPTTGEIIYEKDKDKQVAVASMTKMMAQIIILENIENKKINWKDIVTVSKNASNMGGSQIYLADGEKMSVRDLFKGISMASANDATVAMAEYISGSEEKFVEQMNQKTKELGLKNTIFKNSTGLDEEGHLSSAYDMGMIAKELLKHKQILDFSGVYEDYLRQDTPNKFWLVNTNKLVRIYNGADGLKTGHTDAAKYCIAATAKKDDMRLIAIVLGEENATIRNKETSELLDYGFNTKQLKIIKNKKEIVKTIKLEKANKKNLNLTPKEDITILSNKGIDDKKYKTKIKIKINKINLPIKKGQELGTIEVYNNNKVIKKEKLISSQNINKLKYIEILIDNLKKILTGIL